MGLFRIHPLILLVVFTLFFVRAGLSQDSMNDKHIEVCLRMIGDRVLLSAGDSSSRVLPIEKGEDQYIVRFENKFLLNPDLLLRTVNEVMAKTQIARGYFLEVKSCATGEVVYSVEIGEIYQPDLIPCQSRAYTKDCYTLHFTFKGLKVSTESPKEVNSSSSGLLLYIFPAAVLMLLILFWWRSKKNRRDDPNVIHLGAYQFKVLSGELRHKGQIIELTSKEADLLLLLHARLNATVERDLILNQVWGDEGDYVGRTLDVFISKLRKKLELDPLVKIVNVRGVGYKLLIED